MDERPETPAETPAETPQPASQTPPDAHEVRHARAATHPLRRHDPLPFLSALLVLGGIFLVSTGLGREHWLFGKITLVAVTLAYVACLVAGAAVLERAGRRRAARTLGLLAAFFLPDAVFNTTVMPHLEEYTAWIAVFWWLASLAALVAIPRALRIPIPGQVAAFAALCLTLVVFVPQRLDDVTKSAGGLIHLATLAAVWLGAAWVAKSVRDHRPDDTCWNDPRWTYGLVGLWTALLTAHAIAWTQVFDLHFGMLHLLVPILALLLVTQSETVIWTGGIVAAMIVANQPRSTETAGAVALTVALVLAAILLLRAIELRRPRLVVSSLIACLAGLEAFGASSQITTLALLGGAAVLAFVAWRFREPLSAVVVALVASSQADYVQIGPLGWGVVLLVAGFSTLLVAVARQLRRA